MAWFKLVAKETFKHKLTWIYAGFLMMLIIGRGLYNNRQPDETIASIENRIASYEFTLSQAVSHIRNMQLYDETYDQDDSYFNALNQQSEYVKAWKQDMQEGQFVPVYEHKLMENLLQQDINVLTDGPLRLEVDHVAQERFLVTSYMVDHNIPYMEEVYPLGSALFALQNIPLILSLFVAMVIIIGFGLSIYQDQADHKLDYFMTLPLLARKTMAKYSLRIIHIMIITLVIFTLSLLPMWIQGNSLSLSYPYLLSLFDTQVVLPVWQVLVMAILAWIIGLLCLHIISILWMTLCSSREYVMMAMILSVLLILASLMGSHLQIWNPLSLLVQFDLLLIHNQSFWILLGHLILLSILLILVHYSGMMVWIANRLVNGNKSSNRPLKQARLIQLPTWLSFEWTKRIRLDYVRGLTLWTIFILFLSYAYISYRSITIVDSFRNDLVQDRLSLQEQYDMQRTQIEQHEELAYLRLKDPFDARTDPDQTFSQWYQNHESSGNLYEFIHSIQGMLDVINETLDLIDRGQLDDQTIINYRDWIIQELLVADQYTLGSYDDQLLSNSSGLILQMQNQWIEDRGLKPILKGVTYFNPYQYWQEPIDRRPGWAWVDANIQYDHSTLHSLYLLVRMHLPLLILLLVLLAWLMTLSEEYELNRHIDWLRTLPEKASRLYWHKLKSNVFLIFGMLGGIFLVYALVSFLIGGWGQGDYPIPIFDPRDTGLEEGYRDYGYFAGADKVHFHFESLAWYLGQTAILFSTSLVFLICLSLSLSTIIRRRFVLIIAVLVVMIGGYLLSYQWIDQPWIRYSPFIYLNIRAVSDGWLALKANNEAIRPLMGATVQFIGSVISLGLGYFTWLMINSQGRTSQSTEFVKEAP